MEKKFYFIRGNEKHPEKVSAVLEKLGARHTDALDYDYPEHIYFINPKNEINWTDEDSTLGLMLQEYGEEIFPHDEPSTEPSTEFQPFQKVLVRDNELGLWRPDLYCFCVTGADYPHSCVGNVWSYCIPYEGNERLLGTTDKP